MFELIDRILECHAFAVTGVSRHPSKFGHRIYFFLKNAGYEVFAVNPNADCIEVETCYASLADLPKKPECVVTVTQPWVTVSTLNEVRALGIPYVWMQPGSEPRAIPDDMQIVHGGPCIMVEHRRLRQA